MMNNNDNLIKWLNLKKIPFLGDFGIKRLWDHFKSIGAIWAATFDELNKVEGLPNRVKHSLIENRNKIHFKKEELSFSVKTSVLTFDCNDYPKNLLNIPDPPSLLYKKGNLLPEDDRAIAIVGTRKASIYGRTIAKKLGYELSKFGITIVSGMATGIDTFAHEGAIEACGRTIAVLGCGIDKVYPIENKNLSDSILNSGCIISELAPGVEPESWNFPKRNRIIAGLSHGVIVVEGSYESGAMITAKLALDYSREVFAVPGDINLPNSKGPNWLIKQGAKLVESVEDVVDELTGILALDVDSCKKEIKQTNLKKDSSLLSLEEKSLLKNIFSEPLSINNIINKSEMKTDKVLVLLSQLEMKGFIKQLPGKFFVSAPFDGF